MYKVGVITALDEAKARVRVQFNDMDGVVSYWLPIVQQKTLRDKSYWMPDINEHVACLLDENGEEGVVVGAIYSDADAAPVANKDKHCTVFADGTRVEYDRQTHTLTADVQGKINVIATARCDVTCADQVVITSATHVTLQAPSIAINASTGGTTGSMVGTFNLIGTLNVEGNIHATGTIIDDSGNTNHHGH